MISAPQIIESTAQDAAVIHLTVPRNEMMKVFGPAVGEVMKALAAQGTEPAGPVFAHHLRMTAEMFDFEVGVAVAKAVTASGRVKPGVLPAARVARTVYSGGYEGLPGAWGEFTAWMKAQGLTQAEDLWEVYSTGPQASANPADWRTELNRPLKS